MYPSLRPGDRLLVRGTGQEDLRLGDIVLLKRPGNDLVAHRLVKALPDGRWITKGDSLMRADPAPADLSHMAGRVEAIVRGRRLIRLSSGPKYGLARLRSFLSVHNLTSGALRVRGKNRLKAWFAPREPRPPDPERRLLIAILEGRPPDDGKAARNVDWERFREIACEEGVPGIVYARIRDTEVPPEVLSTFKNLYASIAARNLLNVKALESLEPALQAEGIALMSLKGASLLGHVYAGMGMRPMTDLDLMVRVGDQARLQNLLAGLGYRRVSGSGHLLDRNNVILDLHVHALNTDRIANRSALFPSGMEPIWENSLPWKDGCCRLRRPDDVDNLLLLSQHIMKHSFSGLIWLVDMHELLKDRDDTFWERLFRRADHLGQKRALSYPLYLLDRLFGFRPPKGNALGSEIAALSRIERALLEPRAEGGQAMDRSGVLLALLCIDGLARRIAFLRETLFPDRQVVAQEFGRDFEERMSSFCLKRLLEGASLIAGQLPMILTQVLRRSR